MTLQLFLLCFDDCADVEMAETKEENRTRRKARRKKLAWKIVPSRREFT